MHDLAICSASTGDVARLAGPGGARSVVAESVDLRQNWIAANSRLSVTHGGCYVGRLAGAGPIPAPTARWRVGYEGNGQEAWLPHVTSLNV